jgi:hypothetical protein
VIGAARWRGQPGFFEIWFLVLFVPSRRRAWWLRYTTWAPAAGPARATLWAAAFAGDEPPLVQKRLHPIDAYAAGTHAGARIGDAVVAPGVARGRVGGLAWDVTFDATVPRQRPAWLHRLPAPTRAEHLTHAATAHGWVERAGAREDVAGGHVVAKHLWGTRRVEELLWVWCPALEATAVRLHADRGPRLTTVTCDGHGWDAPWHVLRNRVTPEAPGVLRVEAVSATRRLRALARCDPATLAGWTYRDPAGWDVYVAQSDVASCEIELSRRPHPLAAWSATERRPPVQAAVEFHHPRPLPGVRYLGWDEEGSR